jgi:hypothetical protein
LATDQWLQTEIISKGHYIDRIYIKRSIHMKHASKSDKLLTSKSA